MGMHLIDWAICASLLSILVIVALKFRQFGTSVTGFLAANRCAGRYLLCVASNMAQTGVITLVWFFQLYYDSGWTSIWWSFMENPAMIVLALTGWVIYRFRETRALTLAQFFEERYSKRFRVFCGVVAFISGVINYAIFPAVTAYFFIGLCGFPDHFNALGVDWNTHQCIMALLLSLALFFVFVGGQIVIMAVDFLQGVFCNVAFLVIIGFCLVTFGWDRIQSTMLEEVWNGERITWRMEAPPRDGPMANWAVMVRDGALGPDAQFLAAQVTEGGGTRVDVAGRPDAAKAAALGLSAPVPLTNGTVATAAPPEGRSMVHPFRTENEDNFNVYYWMISAFILFYTAKAWQGGQGFNASALNPHEAKMAQILTGWKWRVLMLVALVVPVCVKVFMHHPDYAPGAAVVHEQVTHISESVLGAGQATGTVGEAFGAQLRTPVALSQFLPIGIMGLMAAALLGAYLSTDNSYLHSWGAILVQDVYLPFRRRPLSQREHIWLLRAAILGVAIFAFVVGVYYKPGQYIANYAALTASVFVAGAGVCIIGGLYWRWGNATAAWAAMLSGIVCSVVAFVAKEPAVVSTELLRDISTTPWGWASDWLLFLRESPKLSGQVLGFFAIVIAVALYVVCSVASLRRFDLDRLLHRGKYHDAESSGARSTEGGGPPPTIMERLGFTREFTGTDKWVTWVTIAWPLLWTGVFIIFTAYNLTVDVSSRAWMDFWRWWTVTIFVLGIVIVVWFSVGGFRDLVAMYRRLKVYKPDEHDDGTVGPEQAGDGNAAAPKHPPTSPSPGMKQ